MNSARSHRREVFAQFTAKRPVFNRTASSEFAINHDLRGERRDASSSPHFQPCYLQRLLKPYKTSLYETVKSEYWISNDNRSSSWTHGLDQTHMGNPLFAMIFSKERLDERKGETQHKDRDARLL